MALDGCVENAITATGPGWAVALKVTRWPLAIAAVADADPAREANVITAEARPLASVGEVAANVPFIPLQLTIAPGTVFPASSTTLTTRGAANSVLTRATCPSPETTTIFAATEPSVWNENTAGDATSATLHDHLGDIYAKQGKLELAKASWQKAVTLLADPELEVRYAIPGRGWVDEQGRPVEPPPEPAAAETPPAETHRPEPPRKRRRLFGVL